MIQNNKDKDFPGYPHYPAREDILNQPGAERVDMDVENLSRSHAISSPDIPVRSDDKNITSEDKEDIIEETSDADITADDLIALEETDADTAKVDVLEGEKVIQGLIVRRPRQLRVQRKQGLDLRSEQKTARRAGIDQRFHAKTVARQ